MIDLEKYRSQHVTSELKELLKLAEAGKLQGLAFVVKFGPDDHRAGMAGDYQRRPEQALRATFLLERHLREDIA